MERPPELWLFVSVLQPRTPSHPALSLSSRSYKPGTRSRAQRLSHQPGSLSLCSLAGCGIREESEEFCNKPRPNHVTPSRQRSPAAHRPPTPAISQRHRPPEADAGAPLPWPDPAGLRAPCPYSRLPPAPARAAGDGGCELGALGPSGTSAPGAEPPASSRTFSPPNHRRYPAGQPVPPGSPSFPPTPPASLRAPALTGLRGRAGPTPPCPAGGSVSCRRARPACPERGFACFCFCFAFFFFFLLPSPPSNHPRQPQGPARRGLQPQLAAGSPVSFPDGFAAGTERRGARFAPRMPAGLLGVEPGSRGGGRGLPAPR